MALLTASLSMPVQLWGLIFLNDNFPSPIWSANQIDSRFLFYRVLHLYSVRNCDDLNENPYIDPMISLFSAVSEFEYCYYLFGTLSLANIDIDSCGVACHQIFPGRRCYCLCAHQNNKKDFFPIHIKSRVNLFLWLSLLIFSDKGCSTNNFRCMILIEL